MSPALAPGLASLGFGVFTRVSRFFSCCVLAPGVNACSGQVCSQEIVSLLGSGSERGFVERNSQKDEKSCIIK